MPTALSDARALAALSLASLGIATGLLVWYSISDPVALAITVVSLVAAAGCTGYAIMRAGLKRTLGIAAAIGFVAVMIGGIIAGEDRPGRFLVRIGTVALFSGLFVVLARAALRRTDKARNVFVRQHRPERPVVIMNPKSGGGKVVEFGLVEEARRHGVEVMMLEPGSDLRELAEAAVRGGADCLGMAGGDGSQALVAEVAMKADLPHVVIPAGTRNHLALDLGIDRADPRKAFAAFDKGFLGRMDLGYVGGQVFVNNVAMGAYAEIVHEDSYRNAKFSTTATKLPELMAAEGTQADLRFSDPDGNAYTTADVLLVSNNPYQMRSIGGFGQRSGIDGGVLGVAVLNVESGMSVAAIVALGATGNPQLHSGFAEWTCERFRVTSATRIAAGVDGEAMEFASPLDFEIKPRALQVLLPPGAGARSLPSQTVRSMVELLTGAEEQAP